MNLKVHRLWDEHLTLAIRSRGRYDARGWANARAGSSAWENRLWELSLIYENNESGVYIAAGRILPRRLAAAGYLDGAMAEFRLSNSMRLGVLGGSQPDWLYRTSGPSLNRGGAYFTFLSGSRHDFYFEQTVAGIGEAHADRISRSFVALSGTMSYGTRWGVSHTAEIDVNTGWRKERSEQAVSVSRAYVYGYYRLSRALRFGLSYDNLKRYWTYEYISMADSLFDDRERRGWRARADLSPLQNWYLSGSFGLRHNPDENATETYSFNLRKTRFIIHAVSVSFMHNGFDGPHEHGTNYSARMQVFTVKPGIWHFAYGRYKYTIDDVNESRSSWYLESGLDTDFGRNYYAGGSVQYSTGADIDGWRYQLSIGYRL